MARRKASVVRDPERVVLKTCTKRQRRLNVLSYGGRACKGAYLEHDAAMETKVVSMCNISLGLGCARC